ncbi:uncharacterized protein LOC119832878 [Zerene cesonia]|uniref:uncharacterized protein LOC119832878 n=1 Tax=Zerene cesonia TaxID=33412 RepID=UPI0018E57E34|nr:uncharacterized protein LOC119832878 [Zerene cesonia]
MTFYVVQFLELPYEGINNYVCVPHTWVILGKVQDEKAVIAYPADEDPSLTRDRVKKKERYNDEWRFYMAKVKYQSANYQIAENWITTRIKYESRSLRIIANNLFAIEIGKIPDTQGESTLNMNSGSVAQGHSSTFYNPRKHLLKEPIKRPALPELNQQSNGKQLKLNRSAPSSSTSVTASKPASESKKDQPTSIQVNQPMKLIQTQEAAAVSKGTEQSKKALSLIVKDVNETLEVIEINNSYNTQALETTNKNNSKAASASAEIPSTSNERTSKPNLYNNQEHHSDSESLQANFRPQIVNVRSLANIHNDDEVCVLDVSDETESTTNKVLNPSNSMDQSGSSSAHSVQLSEYTDEVNAISQSPSQNHHHLERNANRASKTQLALKNASNSSEIPSDVQILSNPLKPLHHISKFPQQRPSPPNHLDSQRKPKIARIPNRVSTELQNARKATKVKKGELSSILPNLLISVQQTLSATNKHLQKQQQVQAKLNEQSTEYNNRGLISSVKNITGSVTSNIDLNVTDNKGKKCESVVEPLSSYVTSDSDVVTDEEISDDKLSTDRVPFERINDNTSTGTSFASSSAHTSTAAQNDTSHARSILELKMLDHFADMYNTLRSSFHETAQIFKKLLDAVEQFNSAQNSASNESFSISLTPEVRQSPDERHTEVSASNISIMHACIQDQKSNDDANTPLEINHNSRRFVLPPEYDRNDTKWTLKYKTHRPGLVELVPQSGVYVRYEDLKYCLEVSKDCKSLARRLLTIVFRRNALSVCLSMTERMQVSNNIGSNARPELDDHACTVLLNFVLEHGIQRGWNTDLNPILSMIHSKIREVRFRYGVMVQC